MDRKGKGKQIAGAGSSSGKKRKGGGGVEFRDEGLRINSKRKKPGVLQFFEESAEVGYYGGSSDEECDMDDLFNGNFVFFLSCMRCLFVNVGFVDFDFVAFDDLGLCLLLALRFLLGKVSIFAGIPNF